MSYRAQHEQHQKAIRDAASTLEAEGFIALAGGLCDALAWYDQRHEGALDFAASMKNNWHDR